MNEEEEDRERFCICVYIYIYCIMIMRWKWKKGTQTLMKKFGGLGEGICSSDYNALTKKTIPSVLFLSYWKEILYLDPLFFCLRTLVEKHAHLEKKERKKKKHKRCF